MKVVSPLTARSISLNTKRDGATVLEVLFALAIILVGLVGIAAMVPFAARQATQSYKITHALAAASNTLASFKGDLMIKPSIDRPWQLVDDFYTGMLGMHGTKTSNYGVSECDLLIAIGVRFSDRVLGNEKKFASKAKILQFDIDPAEINKNIMVDQCVIGDIKDILKVVLFILSSKSD